MKILRIPLGIIGFIFIPFFALGMTVGDFFINVGILYKEWKEIWKHKGPWGLFDK